MQPTCNEQYDTDFYLFLRQYQVSVLPRLEEENHHAPGACCPFNDCKDSLAVRLQSFAYAALEMAEDLALHFHAEISLLNVVPLLSIGADTQFVSETQVLQEAKHRAEEQLAVCVAELVSKGHKASSSIELGNDVAGNIMMVIKRDHIDMVVISRHGMSGWRPMVFGSIAEKVVKLVQCPLMLLHSRKPSTNFETAFQTS